MIINPKKVFFVEKPLQDEFKLKISWSKRIYTNNRGTTGKANESNYIGFTIRNAECVMWERE